MAANKQGALNAFEPPRSISDQVYELLKTQILSHQIKPGEALVERETAARLHTSRTPLREAFRRLEQDGLVTRIPRGGLQVTEITDSALREVYGIRAVLEAYAAELACRGITRRDLDHLNRLNDRSGKMLENCPFDEEQHFREFSSINTDFHDTICRAARSEQLLKVIHNVRMPILRYRHLSVRDRANRTRAWNEHREMVKLLTAEDAETLWALSRRHVFSACAAALKYMPLIRSAERGETN